MTSWQDEVESAISAFLSVAHLANDAIDRSEIEVEYLSAPHRPPFRLPTGKMAVCGFWGDGCWLKVGKVGLRSQRTLHQPALQPHQRAKRACGVTPERYSDAGGR